MTSLLLEDESDVTSTITLTHNENVELIKYSDHSIMYVWENETKVKDNPMAIILNIALEILNQTEGYEHYDKFIERLNIVDTIVKYIINITTVPHEILIKEILN